jgi:REP element-mobilizing transposase RayT
MLGFDYSQNAVYFVTSCCKNRTHHFGEVHLGKMNLSEFGKIVETQIEWLQTQYPYIELHNYVVMPNHVHILFGIDSSLIERTARELSQHELSVQDPIKIKSVSSIMGAFKTTTSKQIHLLGNLHFEWQRSFHDHIVRNAKAYDNIFNYITDNPNRWKEDTFNEDCDVNHVENE